MKTFKQVLEQYFEVVPGWNEEPGMIEYWPRRGIVVLWEDDRVQRICYNDFTYEVYVDEGRRCITTTDRQENEALENRAQWYKVLKEVPLD
jgi:c-di-AMP phosphodiesterase-like protein